MCVYQSGSEASAVASVLQQPADKFGNDVCTVIVVFFGFFLKSMVSCQNCCGQ